MPQETTDEQMDPFEALEVAADHKDTAEEHKQRANDLVEQAEENIEKCVESKFPIEVSVTANADEASDYSNVDLFISIKDSTSIVTEALDGEESILVQSQHMIAGENPSYGTSKTQRDRIQNIKAIINDIESEYDEGAPVDVVIDRAEGIGIDRAKADREIEQLKQKGEVYEPRTDHLRTT